MLSKNKNNIVPKEDKGSTLPRKPALAKNIIIIEQFEILKKQGLTRDLVNLYLDLMFMFSGDNLKIEDHAFITAGFKYYWLFVEKKAADFMHDPRTLSEAIAKLEKLGLIATNRFQFSKEHSYNFVAKSTGRSKYICFLPDMARKLLYLENNDRLKNFVESLEQLIPDYKALAKHQKQLKEKQLTQIEIKGKKKTKRISVLKESAVKQVQNEIRQKMNQEPSNPKTEGRPKMKDENEYLNEDDIRNLPEDIMDDYCKRQAIESLQKDLKKGIHHPKDYYTNDAYIEDLDGNFTMPVRVNPRYDTDVCLEDIVNE